MTTKKTTTTTRGKGREEFARGLAAATAPATQRMSRPVREAAAELREIVTRYFGRGGIDGAREALRVIGEPFGLTREKKGGV